jgi:hypothetical protein
MNDFENGFQHQMNKLDLKRKDVAEALGVTMPTLKSKLRNPEKLRSRMCAFWKDLTLKLT